jgi:PAS domain S-box-containing protein
LQENLPVGVFRTDIDGNLLSANIMLCKLFGYTQNEILQLNTNDLYVNHDDRIELIKQIKEKDSIYKYHVEFKRKDGSIFWGSITEKAINNENGTIEYTDGIIEDITERKKTREELAIQKQYFSNLFQSSPDAIAILNKKDIVIDINKRFTELFEYNLEEAKGKYINDLIVPADLKEEGKKTTRAVAEGNNIYLETQRVSKSGKRTDVTISGTTVKLGPDSHAVYGIYRDITKRKQTENELIENERRYRVLADASNEAIFISENGICIDANKKASEMFGYSHDQLIGIFGTDVIAEESKELVKQNLISGYKKPYEATAQHKNGRKFPALFQGQSFEFKGKKLRITTVSDLTLIKKNEQKLIENEKRYRLLADATSEGIVISENGRCVDVNQTLCTLFGYDYDELIGEDVTRLIASDSRELAKKHITEGYEEPYEAIGLKKDGSTFQGLFLGQMFEYNGRITRLATVRDLTEQKKYEQELIEAKIKAEESDKLKTSFLSNMSHEIRTPMNAILGFSNMLADPDLDDDEREEFTSLIETNSESLLNIINDILDVAKIEAGETQLFDSTFRLNSILDQIYLTHKQILIDQNKGHINFNLIKTQGENYEITVDINRFKQILTNLISNAIKFTHEGSIDIGYETKNNLVEFYVKDTGIGVPPESQLNIFDRFRQVDETHTREYGGTGLGLTISRSFVRLMNGDMWVESEPNKGSTFYFTIPVVKPAVEYTKKESMETMLKEVSLENKVFLIAEDVSSNFEFLEAVLNRFNSSVVWARDGREAVDIIKQGEHSFDLILMDIQMPVMNGYDATMLIKELKPDIPIIAQTAYAMVEDRQKALDSGCDDYIAKPIKSTELIRKIKNLLG